MEQDVKKEIDELKRKVQDLEKWKTDRMRQQITYPLDTQSIKALTQYFMRITDQYIYEVIGASAHMITSYIGQQNGLYFQVSPKMIYPYSVNVSSNVFTIRDPAVPNNIFVDDIAVVINSSDTPPSPLDPVDTYYIIDSTGSTFKLSLTVGGAAINITDDGTGQQYISIIL